MKIKNLTKLYIYTPERMLKTGERITKWYYKDEEWINKQQDIDELTRNSAGEIDYEMVKLRIDKDINLNKGDGISIIKLDTNDEKEVINNNKPNYVVESMSKVGKTTLYTLKTYNEE